MRKLNKQILLFAFCISYTGVAFAQSDSITGSVKDQSLLPAIKPANPVFMSKVSGDNERIDENNIEEKAPAPKRPKNAVFAEIFTNGGLYSLNYDRILFLKERVGASMRSGLFFYPAAHGTYQSSIVMEPNLLIGNEKFYFETGLGFTRFIIMERQTASDAKGYKQIDWENYFSVRAGFRMQSKKESGLFFRAGLTPTFYYMDKEGNDWFCQILGGLGFGVSF